MDGLEFRKRGREMVDYIVDYLDRIDTRRVTPNIEPGYLQSLVKRIKTKFVFWNSKIYFVQDSLRSSGEARRVGWNHGRCWAENNDRRHALAASKIPRLFSSWKLLSLHLGRHAWRCYWMRRVFMGKKVSKVFKRWFINQDFTGCVSGLHRTGNHNVGLDG